MNKLIFVALLVIGGVLIVYGLIASDSVGSDVSRLFTGEPTDRAIWLLVGGIVAAIAGGAGLATSGKSIG
jgi:hypothetical protein